MGTYLDQIASHIQDHLRQITANSGLPNTPESVEEVARVWLEKSTIFAQKMSQYNMQPIFEFAQDEERGALVLTYSGSIVAIAPKAASDAKSRVVAYSSIGLRKDVPETATHESAELAGAVEVDAPIVFNAGPVLRTSPVFRIAVSVDELAEPEEQKKLIEATRTIAGEFAEVNRTIVSG